ncbi:hypothetical protein N0V90_002865 [Kalmusia sp. IMI 367209]|nr:hypothetical protein N0V90_002865 [Kalmusia sp. IMI 367209]
MDSLWTAFLVLAFIISFTIDAKDIELPQGNKLSSDLLKTLQSAHGVALNQQARQDLFLNLPLVAPNQTNSGVAIANTSWFVANTAQKPGMNDCLFYTFGLSERANAFAASHNEYSDHDLMIWEDWLFAWNKNIDNPMRCIIQEDIVEGVKNPVRQGYFERMSASMAYMCGGKAAVMDKNIAIGETGEVFKGGIWEQIEFPMLKNGADRKWTDGNGVHRVCDSIDAIGEFFDAPDKSVWWKNWWTRASGLDWANEATKPFCLQGSNCNVEAKGSEVNVTERRRLSKRSFDTSIFDQGGKLEIVW